jgi:hypothetical protein
MFYSYSIIVGSRCAVAFCVAKRLQSGKASACDKQVRHDKFVYERGSMHSRLHKGGIQSTRVLELKGLSQQFDLY